MTDRQLHFNVYIHDIGNHEAAWRLADADPFAVSSIDHYLHLAREAERGKLDAVFFADTPFLFGDPAVRPISILDPPTLLAALAVGTERVGLIATASTTYTEPYDLARRYSTLDHISHGRVGWNMVTTASDRAARNFGLERQPAHDDRYARAEEYVGVVKALWDSWDEDAEIGDKQSGVFARADGIHTIDHVGRYFRVEGPLNIPRSPQRYPLLVQAGLSEAGRTFAARHAEAIFTGQELLADGQDFYADMKGRIAAAGRDPERVAVLPGIVPILGGTEEEARERESEMAGLVNPVYGLQQLEHFFETDLSHLDLDAPLPDLASGNDLQGLKGPSAHILQLARRENLTVRELIGRTAGGRGHRVFVGTPEQLADELELWFRERGADGFNVLPATLPAGLTDFVDNVVPILQERGLFRREYTGRTLREHYGLSAPANRNQQEEQQHELSRG